MNAAAQPVGADIYADRLAGDQQSHVRLRTLQPQIGPGLENRPCGAKQDPSLIMNVGTCNAGDIDRHGC